MQAERLQNCWKFLEQKWRDLCGSWDDSVRRRFEREFWDELGRTVPETLQAMAQLEEILSRARRSVP